MKNRFSLALVLLATATSAFAASFTYTWSPTSNTGSQTWSTSGNWDNGVPVNNGKANLIFDGINKLAPIMDVNWDINTLTFAAGAGAFVLSNGPSATTLTIQRGGIINNSPNLQTIGIQNIVLGGTEAWTASAGPLVFTGSSIDLAGNKLTIDGSFGTTINATINNSIPGSGSITKSGTGTLTFGTSQNISGGLTISGGTLNLSGNNLTLGLLTVSGNSSLDFGAGSALSLNVTGSVTINSGTTWTLYNWNPNDHFYVPAGTDVSRIVFDGYGPATLTGNSVTPANIPEPASATLLLLAAGFGLRRRRNSRKS